MGLQPRVHRLTLLSRRCSRRAWACSTPATWWSWRLEHRGTERRWCAVPRPLLEQAEELARAAAEGCVWRAPFEEAATLGPVVSQQQLERVAGLIDSGLEEGAPLVSGGAVKPSATGCLVEQAVFSALRRRA